MESLVQCVELNEEQWTQIHDHLYMMYTVGFEEGLKSKNVQSLPSTIEFTIPIIRGKAVAQFLNDELVAVHKNISEAAKSIQWSKSSLARFVKNERECAGFTWKYI